MSELVLFAVDDGNAATTDEIVGYVGRAGNEFRLGRDDFTGRPLFRARYGSPLSTVGGDTVFVEFLPRYPDRFEPEAIALAARLERGAQTLVAGDASAQRHGGLLAGAGGSDGFGGEHIDHRGLKGGAQIGERRVVDGFANFPAPELGNDIIGRFIADGVAKRTEEGGADIER